MQNICFILFVYSLRRCLSYNSMFHMFVHDMFNLVVACL